MTKPIIFALKKGDLYTLLMPMIQLPKTTLFYAAHLPDDAQQTIVLIHGAGGSHLVWPAVLRRLPQTAVYAIDLPGHGRSHPPGRQTIAAYAQDVLDFIEALSLQNVVLLGHSMGGAIVQQIGLAAPPSVTGLILLGTSAKLRVSPHILDAISTDVETVVDLLNQFFWGSMPSADMLNKNRQMLLGCPTNVLLDDFLACDQFDLREKLPEITLPTLVISSENDQMTPPKFGKSLAETLPNATFALVQQAGHMMMLEAAGKVAQLVQNFARGWQ
ncbi:alpha/beta fold hydrolase [Candidatus Leptofilum sp.]|uniref:alpha/beta fold hydrolase n=1 Tax=Candidatus Leptofilum sp. TaxID=3241576 RepID=UPI003B5B8B53